jgi:tRNA(Arg) A34 adenosine deaminase TadA
MLGCNASRMRGACKRCSHTFLLGMSEPATILCAACAGGATLPPPATPQPALEATAAQLSRMLAVIENEIVPKTRVCVAAGNKVFGAAVLGPELQTLVADTNHEMECPLFHGEVYVIQKWAAQTPPALRGPSAKSAVFLSTHEPCCMCIASLVWAGFTKIFYFFPYEATSSQGIPYDIDIMHELWRVPSYARRNKLCATAPVQDLIAALPEGEEKAALLERCVGLTAVYEELAAQYHSAKSVNEGTLTHA